MQAAQLSSRARSKSGAYSPGCAPCGKGVPRFALPLPPPSAAWPFKALQAAMVKGIFIVVRRLSPGHLIQLSNKNIYKSLHRRKYLCKFHTRMTYHYTIMSSFYCRVVSYIKDCQVFYKFFLSDRQFLAFNTHKVFFQSWGS